MNLTEEVNRLQLVDLTSAQMWILQKIRDVRNEPDVRKNMYTAHEISLQEHSGWLKALNGSTSRKAYAVLRDGDLIGGATVYDISALHRRADWAFYLSSAAQGHGTGSALEFKFLDHVFATEPIDKLNCEVIDFNAVVAKLHRRFGFVDEGVRRDHVLRDGQRFGAILMGIRREEWQKARQTLTERLFAGA